jgi:hypothetical protein
VTRAARSSLRQNLRLAWFLAVVVALMVTKPCGYLPPACLWTGIGSVPVVLVALIVRFELRVRARFRGMTTPELESQVWRNEPEFFRYLGNDEASVVELRGIIERRDLVRLSARWADLCQDFVRLEGSHLDSRQPLVTVYYPDHERAIAELVRRTKPTGAYR